MEPITFQRSKLRLARLLTVLCWTALLAGLSDVAVSRSGLALQNPYTRPERTGVLEAWNEAGLQRTNVIFVGDSRTGNGFIPEVVDDEARHADTDVRSFNLAGPGSTMPSDASIVDYALNRGARPQLIVWGVGKRQASLRDIGGFQRDEATCGVALDFFRQEPNWRNFCTLGFYATSGVRTLLQRPMTRLPQYQKELESGRRVRGMGWARGADAWSQAHNRKLMPEAPSTPKQWADTIDHMQKDDNVTTPFRGETILLNSMRFGLRRAQQNGCHIIIVNTPLLRARTAAEKAYGYDAYLSWIRNICLEEKVQFVDLNQPSLLPPDSDFADTHHLSARGAERLSRRFTRKFIVPALKASHQEVQP